MRVAVIVAAAGSSRRFGGRNKLEEDLGGRPVILRCVEALTNRPEVAAIIVGVNPDAFDEFKARYGDGFAIRGASIVKGGRAERWETVRNALESVPDDVTHIAVHDGARPCVSDELLERVFEAAKLFEAVVPGVAVSSTLKRISEDAEAAAEDDPIASAILGDAGAEKNQARRVLETIPRDGLVEVQTPQVFAAALLRRAYAQDDLTSTDDAMLVERLGETVRVVDGDPLNIKITTEADLRIARSILGARPPKERPAHKRF